MKDMMMWMTRLEMKLCSFSKGLRLMEKFTIYSLMMDVVDQWFPR